ncbi:hypothetical protein BROUX41_002451 [Berkeleyomyces rouxiae]|uniref:uncharacterized protein n=1 Tax=Berkeleyomyces rouxiae TaxID=2035830 RepID=UPI003B7E3773
MHSTRADYGDHPSYHPASHSQGAHHRQHHSVQPASHQSHSLSVRRNDPRNSVDFLTGRDSAASRANSTASAFSSDASQSPSVSPRYNLSTVDHPSSSHSAASEARSSHNARTGASHLGSISLPPCRSLLENVDRTMSTSTHTPRHERVYQQETASHHAYTQREGASSPFGHPHATVPRHSYPPHLSDAHSMASCHPRRSEPTSGSFATSNAQHQSQHHIYHQHHQPSIHQQIAHPPPNFSHPNYAGPCVPEQRREPRSSKPRYNKEYTPEQIHFCLYTFIDKKLSWTETLDRYNKLFPSDQNRGTAGLQGVMYRENKVFPCTDKDGNLIYNTTTERFETSCFPIRSQGDKIGLLDRYPDAALDYPWVDEADKQRIWERGMRQKNQRLQARLRQQALESLPSPLSSPGLRE